MIYDDADNNLLLLFLPPIYVYTAVATVAKRLAEQCNALANATCNAAFCTTSLGRTMTDEIFAIKTKDAAEPEASHQAKLPIHQQSQEGR